MAKTKRRRGRQKASPSAQLVAIQAQVDALVGAAERIRLRGESVTMARLDDPRRHLQWVVRWNEYPPKANGRPSQRGKFFKTQAEAEDFCAQLRPLLQRKARQERAIRVVMHS